MVFTEEYLRSIDPDRETRGDLLTAEEAAAKIGRHKSLIDRWVRDGYIKPAVDGVPRGQHRLYWEHDLLDCLTSSSNQRADRDARGRFLQRVALA